MPESNAELVEAAFAALNRRDAAVLAALCTPDVEGHAVAERIDDRGAAAVVSGVTRGPGLAFQWHMTAQIEGGLIAAWSFHPTREHAERAIG